MKPMAFLMVVLTAALLAGCGERKMESVPVSEMQEYRDPGLGWAISYPKEWPVVNAEVGRARFYNAVGVDLKFRVPNEPGTIGVEIAVDAIKTGDAAGEIARRIKEMKEAQFQVQPEEQIIVADLQGTKVRYGANYGKNSIIYGHHIYLVKDSMLYDLGFAGFGQFYDAYAQVFDASLKSFKPAKPKEPGRDETLPSDNYETYTGKFFSFQYPDNFNSTNPSRGKFEEVIELRGRRLDCTIRFDVFDAKGLTVDKVFEQNKGAYRGATAGTATVAGEPARTLTLSPRADVMRKVYFVVYGGKAIRITLDWYKPQTADYTAAYDKVIASVKFK